MRSPRACAATRRRGCPFEAAIEALSKLLSTRMPDMMGWRIFGEGMKYPLFRLGHFPEWLLRRKLYLDYCGRQKPRFSAPAQVEIPEHGLRPLIPEVELGQIMKN